jgi:hypothetical protein
MTKTPEVRKQLAEERQELKGAVADLRGELNEKAQRVKKLLQAATGVAFVLRVLLQLKKRRG